MNRKPTWNRRKEILIGTQEKVNPTVTMARRSSLICRRFGQAAGYYLWMVSRLRGDATTTKHYITKEKPEPRDAVVSHIFNVDRKTVERWNKLLVEMGAITITNVSINGRTGYNEYTLLPINDIINDYGTVAQNVGTQTPQRVGTQTPQPSGALTPAQSTASSSPHPKAAEQAEAGRGLRPPPPAATAGSASLGRERTPGTSRGNNKSTTESPLSLQLKAWLRDHEQEILMHFAPRTIASMLRDFEGFVGDDQQTADLFIRHWPLLLIKLGNAPWIKKAGLGFGWLFQFNKNNPSETNLSVLFNSAQYDGTNFPDRIFDPGERVVATINGKQIECIVVARLDGFNHYRVCPIKYADSSERDENILVVTLDRLTDPESSPAN